MLIPMEAKDPCLVDWMQRGLFLSLMVRPFVPLDIMPPEPEDRDGEQNEAP